MNYADHAETFSGKLVDFRKTRFNDSARQSEAASTNKTMEAQVEGRCGVDKLAFFNKEPTIETA